MEKKFLMTSKEFFSNRWSKCFTKVKFLDYAVVFFPFAWGFTSLRPSVGGCLCLTELLAGKATNWSSLQ